MDTNKLSQQCMEDGKVNTSAMTFAYKFFSAWRPIDYSDIDKYEMETTEKYKRQRDVPVIDRAAKKAAENAEDSNGNDAQSHHQHHLKGVAKGVIASRRLSYMGLVGGVNSKAATMLRKEPSRKELKNLINVVRDSFNEGFEIYKETEDESDDEEIEILLDDAIDKFTKTIKLCERIIRKYRTVEKAEKDKEAIYLFYGRALTSKALSFEKEFNFNDALEIHNKAIEVFKKLGDELKVSEHLYNAAWCPLNLYLENNKDQEYIDMSMKFLNESMDIDLTEDKGIFLRKIEELQAGTLTLIRDKKCFHGLRFSEPGD